ncbi:hypothetical protein CVIRNUC_009889 [Coccomyxa viridis]|uniref:Mitochondrial fission process protein 1 n=1 Tax=Coccomyxa viridis TaxID=1274662 RepID=A0AAV1IKC6_9CHLO|nr:hypothetical protein CVIRNUC_009889 [Coccomyxa viridis]
MAAHCKDIFAPARPVVSAHRALSAKLPQNLLQKLGRPVSYSQAASTGRDSSESLSDSKGEDFPQFEDSSNDNGGFLPRREPGSFPNIAVRNRQLTRLSSFVEQITEQHFVGADEKFAVKTAGIKEFDPLRDGPLRYLGYSNECGEAFAAWLPFWGVPFSYAVAVSYVLVDTADKGIKAYQLARLELGANASLHPEVDTPRLEKLLAAERAFDTVVWQLLASVICPGYTIHTVVALAHAALLPLERLEGVRDGVNHLGTAMNLQGDLLMQLGDKSIPTMLGLGAIPFIVHPIDNLIHALMNMTLRPNMRTFVCGPGQGCLADLEMCKDCKVAEAPASTSNGTKP